MNPPRSPLAALGAITLVPYSLRPWLRPGARCSRAPCIRGFRARHSRTIGGAGRNRGRQALSCGPRAGLEARRWSSNMSPHRCLTEEAHAACVAPCCSQASTTRSVRRLRLSYSGPPAEPGQQRWNTTRGRRMERLAPMTKRGAASAGVVNGKIYNRRSELAGWLTENGFIPHGRTTWARSRSTTRHEQLETVRPLLLAHNHHLAVSAGDKLYVIGGASAHSSRAPATASIWSGDDPAADLWTPRTRCPPHAAPRQAAFTATISGRRRRDRTSDCLPRSRLVEARHRP
jgi:hypothetical protein